MIGLSTSAATKWSTSFEGSKATAASSEKLHVMYRAFLNFALIVDMIKC